MRPTEDRPRDKLTNPLDRSTGRRILAQGQMRSKSIVVARVARKDAAQAAAYPGLCTLQ